MLINCCDRFQCACDTSLFRAVDGVRCAQTVYVYFK